jgi:TolA-binding protein
MKFTEQIILVVTVNTKKINSRFYLTAISLTLIQSGLPDAAWCLDNTPQSSPNMAIAQEKLLVSLADRVQALDDKISLMSQQLEATRARLEQVLHQQKAALSPVIPHPSEHAGIPVTPRMTAQDPEIGFTQDEATETFRNAMILFKTEKYPEAVLAFSEFIGKNPNHILAGSAQFYIGESYFKQKEYKIALQEFHQLLKSYDRSTHVPDTLSRMAETEEALKQAPSAAQFKQLLLSTFPQSPAASLPKPSPEDIRSIASKPTSQATLDGPPGWVDTPPTAPAELVEKSDNLQNTQDRALEQH